MTPRDGLPRSALLACWLQACVRGLVPPDDLADAVRGDDPRHLLLLDDDALPLAALPARVSALEPHAVLLALPVAGDLAGLAGPASFNAAALESGEAVLLAGSGAGLVPRVDARTVLWEVQPAVEAAPIDPGEAGATLRRTLLEVTERLVALDVASWRPEIADLLLDLRRHRDLPLPPGVSPRRVETIERAVLCLEIVQLAEEDEGGAVSSYEVQQRRGALADLGRVARRALVAACSDSLARS